MVCFFENINFLTQHCEPNMYIKEPLTKAQAVVIWLHGLGSNPQDMAGLASQLQIDLPIRHVFLAAPIRPVTVNNGLRMPAWYDIVGVSLLDREDYHGVNQSQQMLHQAIEQQIQDGFHPRQIYVAGFSQGAAIALFGGLSCHQTLGGLLILSGYLPCRSQLEMKQDKNIPLFFAVGTNDDIVLPAWSQQTVSYLNDHDFKHVVLNRYPMTHAVCYEEIQDISTWLYQHIQSQNVEVI